MAYTLVEIDLIGHQTVFDMRYIDKVIRLSNALLEKNNVNDWELLHLGAIFHDCDAGDDSDESYIRDGIRNGLTRRAVRDFLKTHQYPEEKIEKVMGIISECSTNSIMKKNFRNTYIEKSIIYLSVTTIIKGYNKKK